MPCCSHRYAAKSGSCTLEVTPACAFSCTRYSSNSCITASESSSAHWSAQSSGSGWKREATRGCCSSGPTPNASNEPDSSGAYSHSSAASAVSSPSGAGSSTGCSPTAGSSASASRSISPGSILHPGACPVSVPGLTSGSCGCRECSVGTLKLCRNCAQSLSRSRSVSTERTANHAARKTSTLLSMAISNDNIGSWSTLPHCSASKHPTP
mmetsp:Transcript_22152/g.49574  ORF Transcript_22152/g.49574 Transcript_22152/m.49574 type:complete len:210 (-) Transcript_22152:382-1011(-)